MILARIFTKIFKEGGIILIDAKGQKYICGNPKTEKPITIKLLKDNLSWKLLLDPELEFPEAYMRNEIEIENASMKDFLMELIKNLGRNEISTTSLITKKIYQTWRTITNFNLPGKSRKNVEHHYDIGGTRGEKLYDIFLAIRLVVEISPLPKFFTRSIKKSFIEAFSISISFLIYASGNSSSGSNNNFQLRLSLSNFTVIGFSVLGFPQIYF